MNHKNLLTTILMPLACAAYLPSVYGGTSTQATDDLVQFSRCSDINDSLKRLACFDSVAQKAFPKKANSKTKAALAEAEKEEALRLEQQQKQAEVQKAVTAAKETLSAFRKFQIRLQTGISYRDYPPALAEVKFAHSQFSEGQYGKKFPEFSSLLDKALTDYGIAKVAWDYKFDPCDRKKCLVIPETSKTYNMFLRDYPDLASARIDKSGYTGLYIDDVMPIIWEKATQRLEEAAKVLPQD